MPDDKVTREALNLCAGMLDWFRNHGTDFLTDEVNARGFLDPYYVPPTGSRLLSALREAVLGEAARECDRVTRIYEHDPEGIGAAACANGIRALAAGEKVPR